ncbi:hypothetical protein I5G61_gp86 [Mycobacterium phage Quesadilla]|uniref:Uncharacterized protein n=1 Tax=Mycobacterium phage Quesadilla TaxID=2664226 RepID=A0A5Q2WEM7_9CAUD|nr:hypothetical protein I5G61_gp86 [Mycobacterium phage Quesadilla]QGH75334.1 hypothetical protein SEA_QUESADILLA_86 [Mycobacterium phage Quesadilla]
MSVTFTAAGVPQDEDGFGELDVNMSNSNAARVAEALGFSLDPDWCGEMDAEAFLGRVLMALAVSPADEGMPSFEVAGPGARMIEGARRPGYLQDRLAQLHELALWARAHSTPIWWS